MDGLHQHEALRLHLLSARARAPLAVNVELAVRVAARVTRLVTSRERMRFVHRRLAYDNTASVPEAACELSPVVGLFARVL